MAKSTMPQAYPRHSESHRDSGCLNTDRLASHKRKISFTKLKKIIKEAIDYASHKSSRAILDISGDLSQAEIQKVYFREGEALFAYFKKYCGDPAATAYECYGRHYSAVAQEQFHNRNLQKERMNSGWRYQRMAYMCAESSKRFKSVSDIGATEADFNVQVETVDYPEASMVNIYVSVKNRTNTMGGQDWPKAIAALEEVAKNDKNRQGPYLCVFGIAMERGARVIRGSSKTKKPYSVNAEIWLSDFFWHFFSNYSYENIMLAVCKVLVDQGRKKDTRIIGVPAPEKLVESFGKLCRKHQLVDVKGKFNDPTKLVEFFCRKLKN